MRDVVGRADRRNGDGDVGADDIVNDLLHGAITAGRDDGVASVLQPLVPRAVLALDDLDLMAGVTQQPLDLRAVHLARAGFRVMDDDQLHVRCTGSVVAPLAPGWSGATFELR